jgi:hypothetical protein
LSKSQNPKLPWTIQFNFLIRNLFRRSLSLMLAKMVRSNQWKKFIEFDDFISNCFNGNWFRSDVLTSTIRSLRKFWAKLKCWENSWNVFFEIWHLTLEVRCLKFVVWCLTFEVRRSKFVVRSSSFEVRRSKFVVWSSSFEVRRLKFVVWRCLTFEANFNCLLWVNYVGYFRTYLLRSTEIGTNLFFNLSLGTWYLVGLLIYKSKIYKNLI